MSLSLSLRAACCLAVAALLAGCPGSLEDPARFEMDAGGGSCPDVPTLFTQSCAVAGCHNGTSMAGGLDLASPDVFQRLSGVKATGGSGLLVDPSAPGDSVLYTKLTATPPFGARMPLTGGPLSDAAVSCVLTWIETSAEAP